MDKSLIKKVLLGIISGWLVYIIVMMVAQSALENSILDAKISKEIYKNDPALSSLIFNNKYKTETHGGEFTWRLLQNLGIINSQIENSDLDSTFKSKIGEVLLQNKDSLGLNLYYDILTSVANQDASDENSKTKTLKSIARSLAKSPYSLHDYEQLIESATFNPSSHKFAMGLPPELFGSSWESPSLDELKALSYTHLKVAGKYGNLGEIETLESYKRFNELITKVLVLVNNNEDVVSARSWVMLFKGTIQLLILMTFFIGFNLIVTSHHTFGKGKELFKFIKVLLPIFGFIGTILGLMNSLSNAYKIPMAKGDSNTSIAISEITNSLGTAFTTTLLAFVLIIVLDVYSLMKFRFKSALKNE